MSYRALCSVVSQHEAEEFGRWLGLYHIRISGLQVWQIGASGRRYKDQPLVDTIVMAAGSTAASVASGGAGAAAGAALGAAPGCLAIMAPIATLLTPIMAPLTLGALAVQPLLWLSEHHGRKRNAQPVAAEVAKDPIVATELMFAIANETDKHRGWTEYLLGCYAQLHKWEDLKGAQHPGQVTSGRAYAARTGSYPPPWSTQPRKPKAKAARRGGVLSWLEDL